MTNKTKKTPSGQIEMGNIEFYTVGQVAELLDLQETTIRKYYRAGKLKGHKFAGRIYFFHSDIVEAIKAAK